MTAPQAAPNGPVKLVALGDSLTAGYRLPADAAFPTVLERLLKAKGEDVTVSNAGVSGDTATGGLDRVDWSVPDGTAGVILELVQLLYEELISALRSAAWATEHGQLARKSERVTRATAILFALEAGLDFENGGDISITFARLYAGARRQIVDGSLDKNPQVFRDVATNIADIAEAWETVRQMNKKGK